MSSTSEHFCGATSWKGLKGFCPCCQHSPWPCWRVLGVLQMNWKWMKINNKISNLFVIKVKFNQLIIKVKSSDIIINGIKRTTSSKPPSPRNLRDFPTPPRFLLRCLPEKGTCWLVLLGWTSAPWHAWTSRAFLHPCTPGTFPRCSDEHSWTSARSHLPMTGYCCTTRGISLTLHYCLVLHLHLISI